MEVSENIQCPFCGQRFEIVVDTSMGSKPFHDGLRSVLSADGGHRGM
jgi:hypothetical protein